MGIGILKHWNGLIFTSEGQYEIQDDGLLDDVVLVPSTLPIESFSSQLVTRLGINSQQLRAEMALAYNNNNGYIVYIISMDEACLQLYVTDS